MKNQFDALVEHLLSGNILMDEAVGLLERRMIEGALARNGGKHTAASKSLGIHRNTLQRKIAEYEIADGRPRRKPATRNRRAPRRKAGVA